MPPKQSPERRKRGRPPSGIGLDGAPEKVSKYRKMTILMRPDIRDQLKIVSALNRQPAWKTVETALKNYFSRQPAEVRKLIEAQIRR